MANSMLTTYRSYVSTLDFFQSQGKKDLVKGVLKDLLDRQETDSGDYENFKDTLKSTEIGKKVNSFRKEPGSVGEIARTLVAQWKAAILRNSSTVSSGHQSVKDKKESYDKGVKDVLTDRPPPLPNLKIKKERLSPVPPKLSTVGTTEGGVKYNKSDEMPESDKECPSGASSSNESEIHHLPSSSDQFTSHNGVKDGSCVAIESVPVHTGADSFEAALLGIEAQPKPQKRAAPEEDSNLKVKKEKHSSTDQIIKPEIKSKQKSHERSSSSKHSHKASKSDKTIKVEIEKKQEDLSSSSKHDKKQSKQKVKRENRLSKSESASHKHKERKEHRSSNSVKPDNLTDHSESSSSNHWDVKDVRKHKSHKSDRDKKHKSDKHKRENKTHKSSKDEKNRRHKTNSLKADSLPENPESCKTSSSPLIDPTEDSKLQSLLETPLPAQYLNSLPELSTEYRPQHHPKSEVSKYSSSNMDYLLNSKKDQLTAVYSGKSRGLGQMYSLQRLCEHVLTANIDNLGYVGDVPYSLLKPVLEKASATQLYTIEDYNAEFTQETDELWKGHVGRDFRASKPQELESWRECYLRLYEEREEKLNNLKKRIAEKQARTADDARKAKVAYGTLSQPKPPKEVRRKQVKYGTGSGSMESTARAHSLMKAESSNRKITPVQSQAKKQVKVIAPLMMKAKKFMSKLNR